MQFRLSTLFLAMVVVATSIALAGAVGVFLAAYMLALIACIRSAFSGKPGGAWPLVVLLSLTVLVMCLLPSVSVARGAARRSQCSNNLKYIGLALLNYRDVYKTFPPAYVPDKDGKPMHSWRVLILPFTVNGPLFAQYNLNEPWDGPNNRKLAGARDYSYICPSDDSVWAQGSTAISYVAVVGPNTVWADDAPAKEAPQTKPGKGPNPADTRLMLVEVASSKISWMEPRDLTVEEALAGINTNPGSGISSGHPMCANALFADGRVFFLPQGTPSDLLETMITKGRDRAAEAELERIAQESAEESDRRFHWYIGLRLFAWLASVLVLLVHGLIFDFRQRRAAKRAVECGNSLPLSDRAASP